MDTFLEYMIAQKKTPAMIVKIILTVILSIVACLAIMVLFIFLPPQTTMLMPLSVALIIYLAYRMCIRYNVEYEYIITNGELDVDKIISRKKRSRIITVHSKTFIAFDKVGGDKFKSEENSTFSRVIKASANSKNLTDYYAVFFLNGQKIKLIFNPTEQMIDIFKVFAARTLDNQWS